MQIMLFLFSLMLPLVAVFLPLLIANKLTSTMHPISVAITVFISMVCAFMVCWCQYYTNVIWIKSADWAALQDVSESMAFMLLGFFILVTACNVWLLKKAKSVL